MIAMRLIGASAGSRGVAADDRHGERRAEVGDEVDGERVAAGVGRRRGFR